MRTLLFILSTLVCPQLDDVDINVNGLTVIVDTQQQPGLAGYEWEYYCNEGSIHGFINTCSTCNVITRTKPAWLNQLLVRVRPKCENGNYGKWTDFETYQWQ